MRVAIFLLVSSLPVWAADGSSSTSFVRTSPGDWSFSGGYTQGYFLPPFDFTGLCYFSDNLAVGLRYQVTSSSRPKLGPVFQYNFWREERVTTYVNMTALIDVVYFQKFSVQSDIGLDYSLTSAISIGPYIRLNPSDDFSAVRGDLGARIAVHF